MRKIIFLLICTSGYIFGCDCAREQHGDLGSHQQDGAEKLIRPVYIIPKGAPSLFDEEKPSDQEAREQRRAKRQNHDP